MGDAAWAQFLHMVEYKATACAVRPVAGTLYMPVDPNGTTQDCSGCGRRVPKTLSERQHTCPHCGFTAPRDVNAALNILDRGRGRTGPPRKGFLVPARVEVAGCSPL
jgi:putative transposase